MEHWLARSALSEVIQKRIMLSSEREKRRIKNVRLKHTETKWPRKYIL